MSQAVQTISANQNARGTDGIPEHVDERGADIQIVVLVAMQSPHDAAVERQRGEGHPEHDPLFDALRMQETLPRLVKDVDRDCDQGEGIRERRQNAGPMIAERLNAVGGFGLHVHPNGRENQRQRVGEIMAGVGNQSQASGTKSGGRLHHDKQKRG